MKNMLASRFPGFFVLSLGFLLATSCGGPRSEEPERENRDRVSKASKEANQDTATVTTNEP